MPDFIGEPKFDCVVATGWGGPSQMLWTRESADTWTNPSSEGHLTWAKLCAHGDLTILTPQDENSFLTGLREGRYEVIWALEASLKKISRETYEMDDKPKPT